MARACAAKTNATFLKISAPELVQMFIGDGSKLVRDAFELARERSPAIIFVCRELLFTSLSAFIIFSDLDAFAYILHRLTRLMR